MDECENCKRLAAERDAVCTRVSRGAVWLADVEAIVQARLKEVQSLYAGKGSHGMDCLGIGGKVSLELVLADLAELNK